MLYNSLSFMWTTITWRVCHVWLCNTSPILLSRAVWGHHIVLYV